MPEKRTQIAKASRQVEPVKTSPLSKENNILPNTFRAKRAGRVIGDRTNELADALGLASNLNVALNTSQKLTAEDEAIRGKAIAHRGGPKTEAQRGFLGRAVYGNTASDSWDDVSSVKRSYEIHNEARQWYEQNKVKLTTEELSTGVSKIFSSALAEGEVFGDRYVAGLGQVLSKSEAQFDAELKDLGVKRVTEAAEKQSDGARSEVMKAFYEQDPLNRDPHDLTASLATMGKAAKEMGVDREKFNQWVASDVYTKARADGNPELIDDVLKTVDRSGQSIYDRMTPEQRIMYDRNRASARVKQISNQERALTKVDKTKSINKEAAVQELAKFKADSLKEMETLIEAPDLDTQQKYNGRQGIAEQVDQRIEALDTLDIKQTDKNVMYSELKAWKRWALEGQVSPTDEKWIMDKVNKGSLSQDELNGRLVGLSTKTINMAQQAVEVGESAILKQTRISSNFNMKHWSSILIDTPEAVQLTKEEAMKKRGKDILDKQMGVKKPSLSFSRNTVADAFERVWNDKIKEARDANEGKQPSALERSKMWEETEQYFLDKYPLPKKLKEAIGETTEATNEVVTKPKEPIPDPLAGILEQTKDMSVDQAANFISSTSKGAISVAEAKTQIEESRGLGDVEDVEEEGLFKTVTGGFEQLGESIGVQKLFDRPLQNMAAQDKRIEVGVNNINKHNVLTEKLLGFSELDISEKLDLSTGLGQMIKNPLVRPDRLGKFTEGQRAELIKAYMTQVDKLDTTQLTQLVDSVSNRSKDNTNDSLFSNKFNVGRLIAQTVLNELNGELRRRTQQAEDKQNAFDPNLDGDAIRKAIQQNRKK